MRREELDTFTDVTYQEWEKMPDKANSIQYIISRYKSSHDFTRGLEANSYFDSDNPAIMGKAILRSDVLKTSNPETGEVKRVLSNKEIPGYRLTSNFLKLFVIQQNQFLLGNGVTCKDAETKKALGPRFDTGLQELGERALLHGVSYGYWNMNHLEVIHAVKDQLSGCVTLLDDMSGEPRVAIQFWQLDVDKPMGVRLFEEDGVTIFRYVDGKMEIVSEKRPYKLQVTKDISGERITGGENYSKLPVVPLYANPEKKSELTLAIKSKIDMYDKIFSDFGDNLERANDVYWVLNNFGGGTDQVLEMLDTINKIKTIINQSDGTGGTSQAHLETVQVPYEARKVALELLSRNLYNDFMAMDMHELTGTTLTNVAIKTATANMHLKADRFEWQAFDFVQRVLELLGMETEEISFKRRTISDTNEVVNNLYVMRNDLDRRTALEINPYIDNDRIETIMKNREQEEATEVQAVEPNKPRVNYKVEEN